MLVHIDGDAFFASVYQAMNPHAKGKPVAIGWERGIATAVSYEAKRAGVTRGMLVSEIRKICPECFIVVSDYRTYELFSQRMMHIARSYSTEVERYSIDEAFVDLTGYEKAHGMPYAAIAEQMKKKIEESLGITVSVGLGATKSLAKIGSGYNKPSGLVVLDADHCDEILSHVNIEKVWGIGRRLSLRMKNIGVYTALDLINQPQVIIEKYFNKSVVEIWHELQGRKMYKLNTKKKTTYQSIQKTSTVTPATTDPKVLQARLQNHIEKAFVKARRHKYTVGHMSIFLKTQQFTFHATNIKLPHHVAFPYLIRDHVEKAFKKIYRRGTRYRASGVTLSNLQHTGSMQQLLFHETDELEKRLEKIYPLFEQHKIDFGSRLFDKQVRKSKKLFKTLSISI